MAPILLLLLTAGPEPLRVSSGWLTVLDLPGLEAAASGDGATLSVVATSDEQLLLLGLDPGRTTLKLTVAGRRFEVPVLVLRDATLHLKAEVLKLNVGQPLTLKSAGLRRAVIGDGLLCDAAVLDADHLEFTPRRPGMTTLLFWTHGLDGAHRHELIVVVEAGGVTRTADELDAVLTEPHTGRLVLIEGEHALLEVPPSVRFAINDPAVIQARASPSGELVIDARGAGATFLRFFTPEGRPRRTLVVVHARSSWEGPVDDGPPPLPAGPDSSL